MRRVAVVTATALLGASLAAAVGTAAAAAGCRVDYAVSNQWQGGFGAGVTVTNLGDPITGWTLTWSYAAGQTVTQAWNATVTQAGAAVTARDAGYNAALPTNGTATFGFNGAWTTSNPAPQAFTLNGTACTGGTTPGTPTTPPPTTPPPTTPPPTNPPPAAGAKQVEDLDRGAISVRS
ncbi:MAG TPA: cellulose-binding domain-containing protein, partial [Asanoa sp.]|nr:cellulose-binding domain-containing protein [Asanoa sp.]